MIFVAVTMRLQVKGEHIRQVDNFTEIMKNRILSTGEKQYIKIVKSTRISKSHASFNLMVSTNTNLYFL